MNTNAAHPANPGPPGHSAPPGHGRGTVRPDAERGNGQWALTFTTSVSGHPRLVDPETPNEHIEERDTVVGPEAERRPSS